MGAEGCVYVCVRVYFLCRCTWTAMKISSKMLLNTWPGRETAPSTFPGTRYMFKNIN